MKTLVTLLLYAGAAMVTVAIPVTLSPLIVQEPVPSATNLQEEERVTNKTSGMFNALKKILSGLTFQDKCMHFRFGFICYLEPGSPQRLNQKIKADKGEADPPE